ncbi:MAG: RNA-binding S4 domain-containing protein [Blastocatellia bacterium]
MRLDLFLKVSRLAPRRSLAQEFCDKKLVSVNGAVAKSSKEIKTGDEIEIQRRNQVLTVSVIQIPNSKQLSKANAEKLFEIIGDKLVGDNFSRESP